jgi:hypothetical protein
LVKEAFTQARLRYLLLPRRFEKDRKIPESAASFCRRVAAWVQDMFYKISLAKITKMAISQQALKLEGKK